MGTGSSTRSTPTGAPGWLREAPAVETLRRVWVQNYHRAAGRVTWRTADDIPPPPRFIGSPYDLDARYARKRATAWLGYKVHVTETCDPGLPRLITDVQTLPAPTVDEDGLPLVHRALAQKGLLPAVHLADAGYMAARLLADSQRQYGVELVGPTRPNVQWQAKAGAGFAAEDFRVDWMAERATCPTGRASSSWTLAADGRKQGLVKIKFAKADCRPCPCRPLCTRAKDGRRTLTLRQPAEGHGAGAGAGAHRDGGVRGGLRRSGPGWRGRCRWASGSAACAGRASSAWRRPACSTC